MSPFHFLLVVGSLTAASHPLGPAVSVTRGFVAATGLVIGWSLLANVSARWTARSVLAGDLRPRDAVGLYDRQRSGFRWVGLFAAWYAVGGCGLAAGVDGWVVTTTSMTARTLLVLWPAVMLAGGLAMADQTFRRTLGLWPDDALAAMSVSAAMRRALVAVRGTIGLMIGPLVVVMAVADLGRWLDLGSHLGPISLATLGVCVGAVLIVGMPRLMRLVLRGRPMTGNYGRWIGEVCTAAGLKGTPINRWDTGGQSANAMVAGLIGRRELWLTDRLIDTLTPPQLAMVVLHEIAHVRRRHMAIRVLSLVPAWIVPIAVARHFDQTAPAMLASSVVGIAMTMLTLRMVAHRGEYDADATACDLAAAIGGGVDHVPPDRDTAAAVLAETLVRVTADATSSDRGGWLHPSTASRVRRLIGTRSDDYSTASKSSKSSRSSSSSSSSSSDELFSPNSAEISSSISIS